MGTCCPGLSHTQGTMRHVCRLIELDVRQRGLNDLEDVLIRVEEAVTLFPATGGISSSEQRVLLRRLVWYVNFPCRGEHGACTLALAAHMRYGAHSQGPCKHSRAAAKAGGACARSGTVLGDLWIARRSRRAFHRSQPFSHADY